jgi:hypothetical protein
MPMHRGRPHAVARPQRRKLVWATFSFADNAVTPNTVTQHDLLGNLKVAGASVLGCTVMRTHGSFAYAPAAVGDSMTYGIVVGQTAETAPPLDPGTNVGDDWMINSMVFPTTSAAVLDASTPWALDLRAKRKLEELNQVLWFVWKPSSAGTSSLAGRFRVLIALP